MDEPEEYIDFMAKYKDWVSIKRLGIRADTKPEEIVHYLAGVRSTADSKGYSFLAIKTAVLDEHAKNICAGMRKNYSSLSSALAKMDSQDTKKAISESCGKELTPLAEAYLIGRIMANIGYDSGINQQTMSKIYPNLKVKKGLGRSAKGN
ncbi:MAG: DUF2666 family protein [Candidatus Micrarchaeaceae archaeon]